MCSGTFALAVEDGDLVIEPTNRLIDHFESQGWPVVFSRDWHPENHCSFRTNGGPWPPHCIVGSPGAEFHPELHLPANATIVSKDTEPDQNTYSTFAGTDLRQRLEALGVDTVIVAGLSTDYCVKMSALDAHRLGFDVYVVIDAVRAVNVKPEDGRRAIIHMQLRGIRFADTAELIKKLAS